MMIEFWCTYLVYDLVTWQKILFGPHLLLSSPSCFFLKKNLNYPRPNLLHTPTPPPSLPAPFSPPPPCFLSGAAPFPLSSHSSISSHLPSPSPSPSSAPPTLQHQRPPTPISFPPPSTGPLRSPMPLRPQALVLSGPRCPSAPGHRPSPATHLSSTIRPNKPNGWPSFSLFGQTEGLCSAKQDRTEALCSATAFVRPVWPNEGPLFYQIGSNRGFLFGPIWPNGIERKADAEEKSAELMSESGKETGPKGKGMVLKREGDKGGIGERGKGGGQEMGVWREEREDSLDFFFKKNEGY